MFRPIRRAVEDCFKFLIRADTSWHKPLQRDSPSGLALNLLDVQSKSSQYDANGDE